MDFWDLTRLLYRRWYFSVPMVVLTLAATVGVLLTAQPDYTATTHVQLIPPQPTTVNGQVREPVNPYLQLGLGSLSELARVSLEGESVAKGLESAGLGDTFTVTVDQWSPLVTIEAVGDTERQATGTAAYLADLFTSSVADYQKGRAIAARDTIATERVPAADKVERSSAKVTRSAVAIAVVGLLLTAGATVAGDAIANRRRRRLGDTWPPTFGEQPPNRPTSASVRPPPTGSPTVYRVGDGGPTEPIGLPVTFQGKAPGITGSGITASGVAASDNVTTGSAMAPVGMPVVVVAGGPSALDVTGRASGSDDKPEETTVLLPLSFKSFARREHNGAASVDTGRAAGLPGVETGPPTDGLPSRDGDSAPR